MHYGGVERVDALRPLLVRFRKDRDASSMEELVRRTRTKLLRIARRIGDPQDAEDSVQAAYHALLGRPELPDAPILPWLIRTVIRIAYRRKALAARQASIADHLARPQPDASPAEHAARAEEHARIRDAVDQLPAKYRNPLVLYYLEGLGAVETARLLDLPASTLRTRLERGRGLLRSRLGPATTSGLLFLPWLLLDGGKALGGAGAASIGGAMQAKAAITLTGLTLAAGTIGVFVGATTTDGAARSYSQRADGSERHAIARLNGQLAVRDALIVELRQRIERSDPSIADDDGAVAATPPGSAPRFRMRGVSPFPATRSMRIDPSKTAAAAERLGVTKEELSIAERAILSLENHADPATRRAAVEALRNLGARRTRAVIAVLTGAETDGRGASEIGKILVAARARGEEHLLVALLKDTVTPPNTKRDILREIGAFDSTVVRDYLVERLRAEDDPYFHADLMMVLGRMQERRAIPAIRELFTRGGKWVVFHFYGFYALGHIGGPEAEALLLEYLRRENIPNADGAIRALAKLNPAVARGEAAAILARPGASKLPAKTLDRLRQAAGRSR